MLKITGTAALSNYRIKKLLIELHKIDVNITALSARFIHFIAVENNLDSHQTDVLNQLLTYGSNQNESAPLQPRSLYLLCNIGQRPSQNHLIRPGGMIDHGHGSVAWPVQVVEDVPDLIYAKEDGHSSIMPAQSGQLVLLQCGAGRSRHNQGL